MAIIDAHVHTQFLAREQEHAGHYNIDCTADGLERELKDADVSAFISIGSDLAEPTPIGRAALRAQRTRFPQMVPVLGINPLQCGPVELEALEDAIQAGDARGVKIYPGYYPMPPTEPPYHRVYRIAERYRLPVIIHTGDTFHEEALVKHASPLFVDELAVQYRGVPFVLAHLGNPWIRECAEMVYKNPNAYADISALTIGSVTTNRDRFLALEAIKHVLDYADHPERLLYGSDWPLCRMRNYAELVRQAVSPGEQQLIFHDNAAKLFSIP
jgi:hypothetical protein